MGWWGFGLVRLGKGREREIGVRWEFRYQICMNEMFVYSAGAGVSVML